MCEGVLSTIELSEAISPSGITCTLSGVLIVTCCERREVWAVAPATGRCDRTAELALTNPNAAAETIGHAPHYAVEVVASECCAFVSDHLNHCVQRITLPPELFVALQL